LNRSEQKDSQMFASITANNQHGNGRNRAGRRFPNGQVIRMEVIDQVEDFKVGGVPDMARINVAGLEALKADKVFSVIVESDESGISRELLDATRTKLVDVSGQLAAARVDIDRLTADILERDHQIESLKSQLAAGAHAKDEKGDAKADDKSKGSKKDEKGDAKK